MKDFSNSDHLSKLDDNCLSSKILGEGFLIRIATHNLSMYYKTLDYGIHFEAKIIKILSSKRIVVENMGFPDPTDSEYLFNFYGKKFIISPRHILYVYNFEWQLEYQFVTVSRKVRDGEKVGYFFGFQSDNPFEYNRSYYAMSELNIPKQNIELVNMNLIDLYIQDPALHSTLKINSWLGCKRVDDNLFLPVRKNNTDYSQDPKIYPWVMWDPAEDI